ncbi:hypothetical protein CAPTEDRAFT_178411 [Capitella teleta]|uniref:Hexosyltransferase n=1 Tax=Capitella teleta TaxID=283909 RepID=R7TCY5_CAPTE|nr:hypothetical protein CAPTEDRAFT_178411 [Capitella teleta]|eukprot:ELT91594.1 hypothetical protein CAPTEDRAFT_178411 [Capitella teleta]
MGGLINSRRFLHRMKRVSLSFVIQSLICILAVELYVSYTSFRIEKVKRSEFYYETPDIPVGGVDPFFRKWADYKCMNCYLKNAPFLIDAPSKCAFGARTKLLFLINSHHANVKKRKAIRDTWTTLLKGLHMKYLFVFGVSSNAKENEQIQNEADLYNDVIQADFVEQYTNLNLKTVTALKWTATFCNTTEFVFKTDDDMFINPIVINKLLNRREFNSESTIYGNCMGSGYPHRSVFSKWYAPYRYYPHRYYGPFCLGSAFIMSFQSALQLHNASASTPYFNVEDVYISGLCGANNGLKVKQHAGIYMHKKQLPNCPIESTYIGSLLSDIPSFYELWGQLARNECVRN